MERLARPAMVLTQATLASTNKDGVEEKDHSGSNIGESGGNDSFAEALRFPVRMRVEPS